MTAAIFIEGGGETSEQRARCREGFRKLLERCGFDGKMPRLVSCGPREAAYHDFETAHAKGGHDFIGLLVDSEDPVPNVENPWAHLENREPWSRPAGAGDDQVFLMTTSMETWIICDRETLRKHYGSRLHTNALPSAALEGRARHEILHALMHATRDCAAPYAKGSHSFLLLGKLDPSVLQQHLPSFARMRRILSQKL